MIWLFFRGLKPPIRIRHDKNSHHGLDNGWMTIRHIPCFDHDTYGIYTPQFHNSNNSGISYFETTHILMALGTQRIARPVSSEDALWQGMGGTYTNCNNHSIDISVIFFWGSCSLQHPSTWYSAHKETRHLSCFYSSTNRLKHKVILVLSRYCVQILRP